MNVFDIGGNVLLSDVPATPQCERVQELMRSDHVKLSWVSDKSEKIPAGSYVIYEGERFTLLDDYKPTPRTEREYHYQPQFESMVMEWGKVPFFMYNTDSEGNVTTKETDWSLTASPKVFLERIALALQNEVNETISISTEIGGSTTLQFASTDIFSALNSIAQAFNTEWWFDKDSYTLYLGECKHGESVTLKVGENVGVPSVTENSEGFYNRFYVFGSTRNIVQSYTGANVNNIANKRLTLNPAEFPNGYYEPYGPQAKVFSKVLVFDDIYPAATNLKIVDLAVRTAYNLDDKGNKKQIGTNSYGDPIYDQYTTWFFKPALENEDGSYSDFVFNDWNYSEDPDVENGLSGMKIMGLVPSVRFESGLLMGREFELSYYSKNTELSTAEGSMIVPAGFFGINYKKEGDYIIPDQFSLFPTEGDNIILFNIKMPDLYIEDAYVRLKNAMLSTIDERYLSDQNQYTLHSYPHVLTDTLTIGNKVKYVCNGYELDTRITAIAHRLDYPSVKVLTIGNTLIKGTIQQLIDDTASANMNLEIMANLNAMTSSLANAYDRAHQSMLETLNILGSLFEIDENGNLKTTRGLYSTKFISSREADPNTGGDSGGGSSYLNELLDVNANPIDLKTGDMLVWDKASQKYIVINKSVFALASSLNEYQTKVSSSNKIPYAYISGVPTALKNPYALTIAGKAYDGSGEVSITAEDLGAITDLSDYYTKREVDALIPSLAGYATETFVNTAIANLINGAPTTLDTLKEIADALADNADVVEALESAIGTKADKTTVDALDTRLDTAEANISTNATNITAQGKTIASHTTSINTLTSDVSGLKTSVSDLEDLFDSDGKALKAVTADNASKLGGQLPSYYATASALTALTTRVSTAEGNITNLSNNKLNKSVWDSVFEIDANGNLKVKVGLYSPKFISSREADPNTGGGSGGAFSLYTWTQVKALTSEVGGVAPTAYALKQAYNEINTSLDGKASTSSVASLTTRVASLESKATSVSVSQTLTTGTEIGKITIDGVSKALYAPSSIAWGSVTGKPSFATVATSGKYSDLSGLPTIPSIAGLASESWVSNNYLPLTGGTLTGYLKIQKADGDSAVLLGTKGRVYYIESTLETALYNGGDGYPAVKVKAGTGYPIFRYNSKDNVILHSGNISGYLPTSLPASDVYAWAKAATKPSYTAAEVGALATSGGTISGRLTIGDYIQFNRLEDGKTYLLGQPYGVDDPALSFYDGGAWRKLIHSGNIGSYNAGSATKLQTARTIWGQSFDGTDKVSGSLYIPQETGLYMVNASDVGIQSMHLSSSGNLIVGRGLAASGGNLVLDGTNIWMRYGAASNTGLILNSSGNVTIGASDLAGTSAKLYVDGDIATSGNLLFNHTKGLGFATSDGKTISIYVDNYNNFHLGYQNVSSVRFNSGNVLIGTTTDNGAKLQVNGYTYINSYLALANNNGIYFKDTEGTIRAQVYANPNNDVTFGYGTTQTGANSFLYGTNIIFVTSTTRAERMRITDGGNVLINRTSDNGHRLQVAGNIAINKSDDSIASLHLLNNTNSQWRLSGRYDISVYPLSFEYYNGTSWASGLAISNGGNVGIGTTDPKYKLEVAGSFAVGTETASSIVLRRSNYHSYIIGASSLAFCTNNNSNNIALELWADKSATFLGAVTMNSTLTATGSIYSATGIYSTGYVSARGADSSSDRRLKDNIAPLSNALNYVLGTNYVSFDWKDTREKSIGIIAQEEMGREWGCLVQKHTETYSYLYGQHTALLGAALQEEDKKVEELKRRIRDLEIRNELLTNEVKDLKTRLNS